MTAMCYAVAVNIQYGNYDEQIVGLSKNIATEMILKLISSISKDHISNTDDGWGGEWQSALWSENLGFAAWILWDLLDETNKDYVKNMVLYEANMVGIDYEVPYYKDRNGNVVYENDSKSEENAWNARIIALAIKMFPEDYNVNSWNAKLRELILSATARPSDICNYEKVGSSVPAEILAGSNINEDGTIINHGLYHIDYMVAPCEAISDVALIYLLSNDNVPEECFFNEDIIYGALINLDLGKYDETKKGHYFYERDYSNVSYVTNMPGENDWGSSRQANYYLFDVFADIFGLDKQCPRAFKANKWEAVRIERMLEMVKTQSSEKSEGQFYSVGEERFVSGEQYAMQCVAQAYLLKKFGK